MKITHGWQTTQNNLKNMFLLWFLWSLPTLVFPPEFFYNSWHTARSKEHKQASCSFCPVLSTHWCLGIADLAHWSLSLSQAIVLPNKQCYSLWWLTFTEPPVIQPQPSELDVILNNPISLPCEATGIPSPFITWQKEGINVIASGTYRDFRVD